MYEVFLMKRAILFFILVLSVSGLFALDEPKGQTFPFNETANEEIYVINMSSNSDAFKIYVYTRTGQVYHYNGFSSNYTRTEEGWNYLTKTPELKAKEKWKSSSDFDIMELSDYICIESKSGNKYNFDFETKHDKLYITVKDFNDEW